MSDSGQLDPEDHERVTTRIAEVLDAEVPGMVQSWSMVMERIDEDADPTVHFFGPPTQLLGTGIAHARMMTLQTEAHFRDWYDSWGDDD